MRLFCIFMTLALLLMGCSDRFVDRHPFHFTTPHLIERVPDEAGVRGIRRDNAIELFRHKEDHQVLLGLTGKRVDFDFATLVAGKDTVASMIEKQTVGARNVSTGIVQGKGRQFLVVKFDYDLDGVGQTVWNLITHEGDVQYHFLATFPGDTPRDRVEALLAIVGNLEVH